MHIYRATRGAYGNPVPMLEAGLNWVNDEHLPVSQPKICACSHPKHWEWGNGTRNGQKLKYPTESMFVQKYDLTKKELKQAVAAHDYASLEMPTMVICANCAAKEIELRNKK